MDDRYAESATARQTQEVDYSSSTPGQTRGFGMNFGANKVIFIFYDMT